MMALRCRQVQDPPWDASSVPGSGTGRSRQAGQAPVRNGRLEVSGGDSAEGSGSGTPARSRHNGPVRGAVPDEQRSRGVSRDAAAPPPLASGGVGSEQLR